MKIKISLAEEKRVLKERINNNILRGNVVDSAEMAKNLHSQYPQYTVEQIETVLVSLMNEMITEGSAEEVK